MNKKLLINELPPPQKRYGLSLSTKQNWIPPETFEYHQCVKIELPPGIHLYKNLETLPDHIKKAITKIKNNTHALDNIHNEMLQKEKAELLVIEIPSHYKSDTPITIHTQLKGRPHIQHIFFHVGKNTHINIIEIQEGTSPFHSHAVELQAEENSQVNHTTLQNTSSTTVQTTKKHAHIQKNATITWNDIQIGSAHTRTRIESELKGTKAESTIKNIFFGDNTQEFDIKTTSKHYSPQTKSSILSKGALNNNAKAINRGYTEIAKAMTQCKGYQEEHALLLSDTAEISTVPNLQIQNNEVQCSHGATIASLDKEKIFYLMSRGLSQKEANKELLFAYFLPTIETFPQTIQQNIIDNIAKKIK